MTSTWVHYTTCCNTQTSAPEDGRNHRPKHVELIGIINELILLHLAGLLHYLYKRCEVKQTSNVYRLFLSSPTLCSTSFLVRSVQLIVSILLQHRISKLTIFDLLSKVTKFQHLESLEMCWRRTKKISWTGFVRYTEAVHRVKGERYIIQTRKRRKANANWIGHILRRNCFLKHVTAGRIDGRI